MDDKRYILSLISKVREEAIGFLEKEINNTGIEGIVTSHGAILSILYENEGKLTMKEIAESINRDKSTVTQLIRKLEKYELVERETCSNDKRVSFIKLTENGFKFKEKFNNISNKLLEIAYNNFAEEEKDILVNLLNKMRNNFIDEK